MALLTPASHHLPTVYASDTESGLQGGHSTPKQWNTAAEHLLNSGMGPYVMPHIIFLGSIFAQVSKIKEIL
jgi:Mn2+/Fe2+ NRAMP family transporter